MNGVFSQTFNGVGGLPFPPMGTTGITESSNAVTGIGVLGGCVKIENVTVDLLHTWTGDIALFLIAPNGTFIELSSGNGGPGNNYSTTVFTDDASANIVTGSPPFNGNFNPEGRQNTTLVPFYPNTGSPGTFTFMNTFDGINADGDWILYLNDFVGGDVGFLNSWSITFSNNGPSFTVNAGPDQSICAGQSVTLNATNTAPNPTSYSWSTGAVTQSTTFCCLASSDVISVTVTDQSGCTSTDAVLINVTPAPVGNPITITACEISGTGQSLFNLTNSNTSIGTGTINWYLDMALTTPIPNPSNFVSGSTTVYAAVTVGICSSPPIPITLVVTSANPALYDMDIVEDAVCIGSLFSVLFTLPAPGVYTYEYILTCGSTSTTSFITTSANPIFFSSNVGCVLSISKITPQGGCPVTFSPQLTDVVAITPNPTFIYLPINICAGTTIDLLDYVSVSPSSPITFHTSLPPTTANQLPSSIITPTSTVNLVAATDVCNATAGFPVVVIPGGIPFDIIEPVCENVGSINLDQFISPPNLAGFWIGQGVSGNFFNPVGLSGPVTITFDPVEACYDNGTITFQVTLPQIPLLTTSQICASASPISLIPLQDPLFMAGTWSGPGVSGTNFDPNNLSGNITLTFTAVTSCTNPASTTINILPIPDFSVQQNIIVCNQTTIELTDFVTANPTLSISFHLGLPTTPSNQIANTLVTANGSAVYYVKAIDINGCFRVEPIFINTTPGGSLNLGTTALCQNENVYNLNLLDDPNGGTGTWSGVGVTANVLDLTVQTGVVNLTFTPDNSCFDIGSTNVEILEPSDPTLDTEIICSNATPFNLSMLADPNFSTGTWTGQGVSSNIFYPSNLEGPISLVFVSDQYCVNSATTEINVIAAVVPALSSLSICETTAAVDLNTLEDPSYTAGLWSGNGVNGNVFETSGIAGTTILTFASNQTCILPATTTIVINELQTPQLAALTICENGSPVDLSANVDTAFPLGIWSGQGVNNGFFDPEGLSGSQTLTFTSALSCTTSALTTATVNTSPIVSNVTAICDQLTKTYTVQFNVSGGNPSTYLVNGISAGNLFLSASIPSQATYSFSVSDINLCEIIEVQGTKNCDCFTASGSMNFSNAPLKACTSASVTALFNNDASQEPNDRVIFILHDNPGPSKGNVFAISKTPTFTFPMNGIIGTIYYISAAVADSVGLDSIDFDDLCLSVSAGVPVVFYNPEIKINPINDFCVNDCGQLSLTLSGEGPYSFVTAIYKANTLLKTDTITTLDPNFTKSFCSANVNNATGPLNIKILNYADSNCFGKLPTVAVNFNITPQRISNVLSTLCEGESIVINGKIYDENNPKGTEIIPSNIATQCDSVITIDLKFVRPTSFDLNKELCETQSINVNGTIYNVNNPAGLEIIQSGNAVGCDSTININLIFTDKIIFNLQQILCTGESIIVNGTKYDATNPTGTETIPSENSIECDSVINVSLTFQAPKSININDVLCDGESKIINGKVYDKIKPSGIEIINNASINGCDSIINVNLTFLPVSKTQIVDTICDGESITINNQVYDKNKTTGSFTLPNASATGCDSTVNVAIYFYTSFLDTIILSIKLSESITYNGVIFDRNNLSQVTLDPVPSANGCSQYTFVEVNLEQEFISTSYIFESESCSEKNDGLITIQEIKGCRNYIVTLRDSIINDPQLPITFANLKPGNYILNISSDLGCAYTDTIVILSSTSEDFTVTKDFFEIQKGKTATLDLFISPQPSSIEWKPTDFLSCSDCINPTSLEPTRDIIYTIYLTNELGCEYTRKITVNVNEPKIDIVFPNIFSPNGDGKNDTWDILSNDQMKVTQVLIYDRWGNKLYAVKPTPDQEIISWDGKMHGKDIVPGVYIYFVAFNDAEGKLSFLSGDLTVMW